MRRAFLALALLALALPALAYISPDGEELSVTATSQTYTFSSAGATTAKLYAQWVTIKSDVDSANRCYFRLWSGDPDGGTGEETVAAATTANIPLGVDEYVTIPYNGEGRGFKAISAVCNTAETATWRVLAIP